MATLTIRNVPDKLLRDLKARAEKERRSLNNEALTLLESAVHLEAVPYPATAAAQVDAWRKLGGDWRPELSEVAEYAEIYSARTGGREVNL